jgi:hypothetical protein
MPKCLIRLMPDTTDGHKMIIFSPESVLALLTHYTDGKMPLDAELVEVLANANLAHYIGLRVRSKDWKAVTPIHMRYEGKKVLAWGDEKDAPTSWQPAPEAPRG